MKTPLYCLLPLFRILSNPLPVPCHQQPPLPLFFLLSCVFGRMVDLAIFNVLFYVMIIWIYTCRVLVPYYQKDLDVCFMQQGTKFSEVWHKIGFLLVHWFDITHTKHTQHTQGPVDWHTHINIYLHHLLCAHSSHLYYIKWLMNIRNLLSAISLLLKNYSLV